MAIYLTNTDELTQIASAIRRILNTNGSLTFPYVDTINAIITGNWRYDANVSNPSQIIDKTCTSFRESVGFSYYSSLTSVNFPACTTIGSYVFSYCSSLTSVNFPACTTIGIEAFYNCTSLRTVSFPACTVIERGAFDTCSSLTSVSFPACTTIGIGAFCRCSSLSVIYLAKNSIVTLNADKKLKPFYNTGITSTTGSIRVPSSLVNSYKTATNWTYYSNRIFAI